MAGLLGDIGNWLIQDPNAPLNSSGASGGLLGAGTPTASTQTPTQSSSGVPYALQPLPQSRLGILLQGILSGLGTTGYKGSAAVGAGANAALEGQMRQRQLNANMTMMGQQYQQGQMGLIGQHMNLAFQAYRIGRILGRPVSVQELVQNPSLMQYSMGTPSANSPANGTTAQPQSPNQAAAPQAPTVTSQGTIPVPGYNSTSVGSSYPQQGQQPAQSIQAPAGQTEDAYHQGMDQAINDDMILGDGSHVGSLEAQVAAHDAEAGQAAAVETAKFNSAPGFATNMEKLKTAYNGEQSVKIMQEVQPIYDQAMASERAHQTAKSTDEQLASDMDLTNSLLKLWNPNNANLRPNTTEAVQEAEGWYNRLAKLKQQILGGTGLSKEVRATMIRSLQSHYAAYQSAYNTTVSNYRKQAGMYGAKPEDEGLWRSDAPVAGSGGGTSQEQGAAPQAQASSIPPKPNKSGDLIIADAQAAIAHGANPAAIKARLKAWGIAPELVD